MPHSLAICTIAALFLSPPVPTSDAKETRISTQSSRADNYVPTNWQLIQFSANRRIHKATIIMTKQKGVFGPDEFRPNGERIEIADPCMLKRLEGVFSWPPVRMATVDDGRSGGGWGTVCFGRLEIETSKDKFFVAISFVGFHLDFNGTNFDSVFWSGPLVRFIDDVYANEYGEHITYKGQSLALEHASNMLAAGRFFVELKPPASVPKNEINDQDR